MEEFLVIKPDEEKKNYTLIYINLYEQTTFKSECSAENSKVKSRGCDGRLKESVYYYSFDSGEAAAGLKSCVMALVIRQ